jgi:hypothetical protein
MRVKTWLLAAVVIVLAGAAVDASTFLAMTRDELVAGSAAVVDARVTQVRSFWNRGRTAILTEALVRVDEVIVGEAPGFVKVRTFGGTVGRLRIEAPGFPTFERGQRLLLFLYTEPADGSVRVQGYRMGQYRIETGADGAERAVPMADAGMLLLRRDGKAAERPSTVALADLKADLREIGERQGRVVP